MKTTTIISIICFLAIIFGSCRPRTTAENQAETSDFAGVIEQNETVAYIDTVISGQNIRIFGQDSAHVIGWRRERRVVYLGDIPVGGIRYREYHFDGWLIEIGFASNRPLADNYFNFNNWDRNEMHPYMDSIVRFNPNGNITIGFQAYRADDIHFPRFTFFERLPHHNTYDSNGVLLERRTTNWVGRITQTFESFHPNGRLASRWITGFAFSLLVNFSGIEWDSLGRITARHEFEHLLPEGAQSVHDEYEIMTTTKYFPNGNIKQITHWKRFSHDDGCPCGEWLFFDEMGGIISREQHPPCDNFEMECHVINSE